MLHSDTLQVFGLNLLSVEIARIATGVYSDLFFVSITYLHLGIGFRNLFSESDIKELIDNDVGFIFDTWESVDKKLFLRIGESKIELCQYLAKGLNV